MESEKIESKDDETNLLAPSDSIGTGLPATVTAAAETRPAANIRELAFRQHQQKKQQLVHERIGENTTQEPRSSIDTTLSNDDISIASDVSSLASDVLTPQMIQDQRAKLSLRMENQERLNLDAPSIKPGAQAIFSSKKAPSLDDKNDTNAPTLDDENDSIEAAVVLAPLEATPVDEDFDNERLKEIEHRLPKDMKERMSRQTEQHERESIGLRSQSKKRGLMYLFVGLVLIVGIVLAVLLLVGVQNLKSETDQAAEVPAGISSADCEAIRQGGDVENQDGMIELKNVALTLNLTTNPASSTSRWLGSIKNEIQTSFIAAMAGCSWPIRSPPPRQLTRAGSTFVLRGVRKLEGVGTVIGNGRLGNVVSTGDCGEVGDEFALFHHHDEMNHLTNCFSKETNRPGPDPRGRTIDIPSHLSH
jgi:hypothetical protein